MPYYFFKTMNTSKYSDFYLEICKYYGYAITEDGKFIRKPKIPEFEYFGKWRNGKYNVNG